MLGIPLMPRPNTSLGANLQIQLERIDLKKKEYAGLLRTLLRKGDLSEEDLRAMSSARADVDLEVQRLRRG